MTYYPLSVCGISVCGIGQITQLGFPKRYKTRETWRRVLKVTSHVFIRSCCFRDIKTSWFWYKKEGRGLIPLKDLYRIWPQCWCNTSRRWPPHLLHSTYLVSWKTELISIIYVGWCCQWIKDEFGLNCVNFWWVIKMPKRKINKVSNTKPTNKGKVGMTIITF